MFDFKLFLEEKFESCCLARRSLIAASKWYFSSLHKCAHHKSALEPIYHTLHMASVIFCLDSDMTALFWIYFDMGIVGHISLTDTIEDENYPQGLVLVPRGTGDDSVVVGPHIRGSRLRASSAGDEEVDLLLPGTARYGIQPHPIIFVRSSTGACIFLSAMPKVLVKLFRAVALDILWLRQLHNVSVSIFHPWTN